MATSFSPWVTTTSSVASARRRHYNALRGLLASRPIRRASFITLELRQRLSPVLRSRPRAHWIEILTEAGVPCGDVRDVPEALADPQVLAREMVQSVEHATAGLLKVVGVPIKLSETPGSVRTAPPTLGQHTVSILRELQIRRR